MLLFEISSQILPSGILFPALVVLGYLINTFLINKKTQSIESTIVSKISDTDQCDTVNLDFEKAPIKQKVHLSNKISTSLSVSLTSYVHKCPPPMMGCSLSINDDLGIIILSGGMSNDSSIVDTLWLYMTTEDKWISCPASRSTIYSSTIVKSNRILTVGGILNNEKLVTDIEGYDFESFKWESLEESVVSRNKPKPRFNASLCMYDDDDTKYVLFGGRGERGTLYNDIWILELDEFSGDFIEWRQITPFETPSSWNLDNKQSHRSPSLETPFSNKRKLLPSSLGLSREAHSSVVIGDKMFTFGGAGAGGGISPCATSQVEVFDFVTQTWSLEPTCGLGPQCSFVGNQNAHKLGKTRRILVLVDEESQVQGVTMENETDADGERLPNFFCQVYILDVNTTPYQWHKVNILYEGPDKTLVPNSRSYFGASIDQESKLLYIFGGMDINHDALGDLCILDVSPLYGDFSQNYMFCCKCCGRKHISVVSLTEGHGNDSDYCRSCRRAISLMPTTEEEKEKFLSSEGRRKHVNDKGGDDFEANEDDEATDDISDVVIGDEDEGRSHRMSAYRMSAYDMNRPIPDIVSASPLPNFS